MNRRNLEYIRPSNTKLAKQIADDKLLTKIVLNKANIQTPALLGTITTKSELDNFDFESLPKSFVLKPVSGLEGGGIEIFFNRDSAGYWIKADKSKVSIDEMKSHIRDIIDGRYSIGNIPDRVFFEERVKNHLSFRYYSYKGIPDIRVIVYKGVPVMSYLRLPTKESGGKANMAIGAIGAGIDMATGVTTFGVLGKEHMGAGENIDKIPGTNLNISGLKIPYWNKILQTAIECQRATQLNYGGFDFLIDRERGPMIVEINARPGLSIQLSNHDGLLRRLVKVDGLKANTVKKGIRLAKDLFGGEIEEEVEAITGKQLIGLIEHVTLFSKTGQERRIMAKVDTGADSTSIDETLARSLGYGEAIDMLKETAKRLNIPDVIESREEGLRQRELLEKELKDKSEDILEVSLIKSSHGRTLRIHIPIQISLSDFRFKTNATVFERSELRYKMIIGRKSLKDFLVDPSKRLIGAQ